MYVYTYMHVTIANVKRSHEFKREKIEVYSKLGERKEKGKRVQSYSNLKNKNKEKRNEKKTK